MNNLDFWDVSLLNVIEEKIEKFPKSPPIVFCYRANVELIL